MGQIVDAAVQTMLDALTVDLISLHDGYPGTDGLSNELSGGSPAYARAAATVNAASGRSRALDADVELDVPAGAGVLFIGFWENDVTDVFHGWAPNGAADNDVLAGYAEATGNTIHLDGHGFSDTERVIVLPTPGGSLPTGLTLGTVYYVISADADSFQVSLTEGGGAVSISADGGLLMQKLVPEVYALQGTHTVQAGTALQL